jgi:DeoR/GlpR family transcriptional regulator of sugar metabolism
VLTDADELEAEIKRSMIEQSGGAVLPVDDSTLGARGQNAITKVTSVSTVLASAAPASALDPLRATGVTSRSSGLSGRP